MKLSDNLKRIRKENNLSQEQLAEKIGVSRQAVSKWESGQSYPEMDKVLLICKLFNYNIDELMNENIKEVDENKQSKNNINKYIDDFFNFITKSVDMFCAMTFKEKIKCLAEQFIIAIVILLIFLMFGSIAESALYGIFGGMTNIIYNVIRNILSSIYVILACIIGVTVLLHIFKVRYLDYYEIVKEESKNDDNIIETESKETNKTDKTEGNQVLKNNEKIILEKKKEKVIIRDPSHSGAKFLNGIIRIVLWFMKFIAIWFGIMFAFSFVGLIAVGILSFLFIKTGAVFIGSIIGIVSLLIMNFIVLQILYNFIVNRKNPKLKIGIGLLIALIAGGISVGIILIGMTEFNYIENSEILSNEKNYNFTMTDDLSIEGFGENIEYIERYDENSEKNNEILVNISYSEYLDARAINFDDEIKIIRDTKTEKIMELIRKCIKDINNKELKNYEDIKVCVYASKENIDKLKENGQIKYEQSLEKIIDDLQTENSELENEIERLRVELDEKDYELQELKYELQELKSDR